MKGIGDQAIDRVRRAPVACGVMCLVFATMSSACFDEAHAQAIPTVSPTASSSDADAGRIVRMPTAAETTAALRAYRREWTIPLPPPPTHCREGDRAPETTCMSSMEALARWRSEGRGAGAECTRSDECACGRANGSACEVRARSSVETTGCETQCGTSVPHREIACVAGRCMLVPTADLAAAGEYCPVVSMVDRSSGPLSHGNPVPALFSASATRRARRREANTCCYLSAATCTWRPRNNE